MAKTKSIPCGNITNNTFLFHLILFGLLFAAVILLFSVFVFSDKMLYSSDFIQGAGFYRSFYVDYVREHGAAPVWNPYQFCGIPYLECFHGDTFYPFTIMKFWFKDNIYRYFGWALLLHVFFAGITMYFCARVFKRSQMASTLAAVSYMFAAYFVSQVSPGHDGKMFVTALFPLTIMLIELAFERKSFLHFTQLGLIIGIIILTPHPQMAYYTLWACALYFAFKLVFRYVDGKSIPALIKPTAFFIMAVVIGLSVSAVHFYGGYKYVKNYSPRADEKRGEDWAKSWSLHPEEVVSLVVPEFCGVSGVEGNTYWGRNFFKDNSEYCGAVPLLMALAAVIMIRSRKTWFFGGLAFFAVIYGLAGDTPFFYLFYHLIPNVKSTRAWSMIIFLFSFSIALLAAFGLDFIIEKSRQLKDQQRRLFMLALFGLPGLVFLGALFFAAFPESAAGLYKSIFYGNIQPQKDMILKSHLGGITAGFWKTFLFLIIPAAVVWLYSRRQAGVLILWIVIAAALVDAGRFDLKFIHTYDQDASFARMPLVDYFRSIPGKFRVLDITDRDFPTNYLPRWGIEEMTSYHGSQPRWYHSLLGGMRMSNMFNINLMNMTNTRYLLLSQGSRIRGEQLTVAGFSEVKRWQNLQVHENLSANERAYLVHDWIVEPDEEKLQIIILSQGFDPKKQVGLFADPGIIPTADTVGKATDSVIIEEYENGYISIRTRSNTDGILVLADNWYPAWKGFVDGTEVEVFRANAAFRGVVVPAGEHNVEFRFISKTSRIGRLISLASLLFVAVVAGLNIIPRRRAKLSTKGK